MRSGKYRKNGSPPMIRELRLAVLRDAHRVWALNEQAFDDDENVLQTFEPKEYHLGMAELYNSKLMS